jgi:hypothetical protein
MGKSALLAAWLASRQVAGDLIPHHFIRRGFADWDDPEALVGSLVAQLEARFLDTREPEGDAQLAPAARLAAALRRASELVVSRGERLVFLIDGLDEYDPRPGSPPGDPLGAFLPAALPRGVSVLCSSRPRHPYVDSLATRGVLIQLDLDDAKASSDNAATVRAFWERAAPELGLDEAFIAEAAERANGNLQHAVMLYQHVAGLPPEQRRVEDIPAGLAGLLARTWARMRADSAVVQGLGVLCAAREALTLDELEGVAGWIEETQRDTFRRTALEVLIETRRTDTVREYRLHHDSIRQYIADALGTATIRRHHQALADKLATWPPGPGAMARRYALRHALLHRAEAGDWADAWRVAANVGFLEAKCRGTDMHDSEADKARRREMGVRDAETDVARTAARCRASGDGVHGERFADLERALGRESHWPVDAGAGQVPRRRRRVAQRLSGGARWRRPG